MFDDEDDEDELAQKEEARAASVSGSAVPLHVGTHANERQVREAKEPAPVRGSTSSSSTVKLRFSPAVNVSAPAREGRESCVHPSRVSF